MQRRIADRKDTNQSSAIEIERSGCTFKPHGCPFLLNGGLRDLNAQTTVGELLEIKSSGQGLSGNVQRRGITPIHSRHTGNSDVGPGLHHELHLLSV